MSAVHASMMERLDELRGLIGSRPRVNAGLSALISAIGQAQRSFPDQVIVIGIAGGSGSGKTSQVANGLARAFPGRALSVTMDDYYRSNTQLRIENVSWDDPRAIDLARLAGDIGKLKSGEAVYAPVYDFTSGETTGSRLVEPRSLIIIEGLFTLHEPVYSLLDFSLYVDVDVHGQIIRRLLRDLTRGALSPDKNLRYMAEAVIPLHQQFVASTKPKADLVLDNEYRPEVETAERRLALAQTKISGWPEPARLLEHDVEYLGAMAQSDIYVASPDGEMLGSGEVFRIREECGHCTLTYKGPPSEPGQERFIFACSLEPETVNSLRMLYRDTVATITKLRRLYLTGGVVIALDRIVGASSREQNIINGLVTEIRSQLTPSGRPDIQGLLKTLGLEGRPRTTASYQQLLHDRGDFQFVVDNPTR